MELAKSFDPKLIEARWYSEWESAGYFRPTNQEGAAAYCIMLLLPMLRAHCTWDMPSAYVDGCTDTLSSHVGDNTLWQPGTDHGIATQIVVERQLDQEN